MTLETLEQFLFWCMAISLGFMLISFVLVITLRPMLLAIHRRIFALSEDDINKAIYAFFGLYKALTFIFFVTPWIALKIISG